jgi:hypothetical protein
MKLEDLKVGAIIMHADRKENPLHSGETLLVTRFINVKEKFEVVCLHSKVTDRIGETGIILFDELPGYELITALHLQPLNDSLFLRHKPAGPKKDLYLRWAFGEKTSLGKIGEKTPYKLENGRNLVVGDIVKISREGKEYGGCLVVHDTADGYYIMGIAADCNDRKCEIKHWNVTLESGFYNRLKGGTYTVGNRNAGIEVVDFPPTESEGN